MLTGQPHRLFRYSALACLFALTVLMEPLSAETVDVVVVAATPSGVAAAIAAAKSGSSVILLEESAHVGGILSGGLTNIDLRKRGAVGGLFNDYKRRVVDHYTRNFGSDSRQVSICAGGNFFEPKIAEMCFRDMLGDARNIKLMTRHRVVAAGVSDEHGKEQPAEKGKRIDGAPPKSFGPVTRLVSIIAENLNQPGARVELRAGVFIDCTYEGDLAALAGVPYRVGRESRSTYGELHAGKVFVRFDDVNPLAGSTGEADDGIQAFCFRLHLTKKPDAQVPIEKPASFNRDDYKYLLGQMAEGKVTQLRQVIQLYEMPNGKYEVNSDHPHPDTGVPAQSLDLAEENWGWPEAGPAERARIFQRYWNYNEGLLWLLQHDPGVPQQVRDEALKWGFPTDEFVDHRHRPHHIYVRQGRRIWGEYTVTENDAKRTTLTGLPKHHDDSIAIAEYPFDSHAVSHFNPDYPMLRPGYFYVDHEPIQLPFRIMVPKCVDGLLVPVACSASHVGYQTIRMEPVFMALGEASGIAAALAVKTRTNVRSLNVTAVQREVLSRGGVILYENAASVPSHLR